MVLVTFPHIGQKGTIMVKLKWFVVLVLLVIAVQPCFADDGTVHLGDVVKEYSAGDTWSENRETTHWLENKGTTPAVLIGTDIFKRHTTEPVIREGRGEIQPRPSTHRKTEQQTKEQEVSR